MKLLEHEAKDLLSKSGIPIPRSSLIKRGSNQKLTLPTVLKSQVPTGGRGKAGGIRVVENVDELQKNINEIFLFCCFL